MPEAESNARAKLLGKTVVEFGKIGFLILFQEIAVDHHRKVRSRAPIVGYRTGRRAQWRRASDWDGGGWRKEIRLGVQVGAKERAARKVKFDWIVPIRIMEGIVEAQPVCDMPRRAEIRNGRYPPPMHRPGVDLVAQIGSRFAARD